MNIVDLAILKKMVAGGGGSGTDNYNDLSNLPQINGETLAGNKTAENLGLQDALTFDSAPTEDSTNPVESGGVYNALAGKQDNLTFDDDPTENSTNPVKSGGVYSALAGKQDNLTFDGVYNASTNKAATESTVTNAIAGLDVSAFSVDADETISSISETDGKVSVTKQDIAIASNQVVAMTGYTKPSSVPANPAIQTNDTANQAFGKLEFKADTNQTNILYAIQNGVKNLCPLDTLTTSGGETNHVDVDLPAGTYHIYCTTTASTYSVVLKDANNANLYYHDHSGSPLSIDVTITGTAKTFYIWNSSAATFSDVMICPKVAWDTEPNVFRPYALPNYDLTRLEAEDRASLAEVVDSGAKNQLKLDGTQSSVYGLTVTWDYANGTVKVNGTVTGTTDPAAYIHLGSWTAPEDGYYKLYAENANSSNIYVYNDATWGTSPHSSTYDSVRYFSKGTSFSHIYLRIVNGYTANNVTIKPMICTLAAWNVSHKFVPYRPNWDLVGSVAPFYSVPINHNMIYRGQNLGATFTDAQHTALSSGNFTDLYLGDYWTKTVTIPAGTYTGGDGEEVTVAAQTVTLKAVIADFDTFYAGYASSYAGINTHHAGVIVTGFNNVVWNKTNSTAGGYVSSLIHKWLVGSVLPQLESWFGSAKVLSHQKLLTNAITGDAASGWAWSSQKISLLSECQLYGMKVWGGSKATNGAYEPGEAHKHLNVFNHIDANLLFGNKNIWCRDIASAVGAANLGDGGYASDYGASNTWIAPATLILLS